VDLAAVTLQDKYVLQSGRVYLSGIQALVRLPLMQRRRDRAAGLNTAGFISGYRGSPLGGYDNALWQAAPLLAEHDIKFVPGLNEDLAATAVWGSQQVGLFPGAKTDGVFGIWYGKGPGVDRSLDVLRHANLAGTSRYGGVLAIAGDDHGAQSSTTAHQSEQAYAAVMMPVLNPASIQEYLDFGFIGFALSRYSGCWIGFKALSETVDSSATVEADPQRVQISMPRDFEMPPGGLHIRAPRGAMDWPLDQEHRLHGAKLAAVKAFARANSIIDEATAAALGIRLYKVGLAWPLEPEGARRFAQGLAEILVVEEKRAFLEDQLRALLFNADAAQRPLIVGKNDESGAPLLPTAGELTPTMVARMIVTRLKRLGEHNASCEERLARLASFERGRGEISPVVARRTPFFCSGCPHNTSTRLPQGSRAMAGIGCHSMALFMPSRETATLTQMGGEGANWIGQAPFTAEKHVFQNLGDGTYSHSGLIAIRAAAAAGVNITYKILYNDAVAMTGGQPVEGSLSVAQIAQQVFWEGAKRVVILSDEPDKYSGHSQLPPGTDIRHRDALNDVQRELREVPGLTVLIYDQTCAAEKRRRRKRGMIPDPPTRIFINDAVCEGCGDCSEQSNCISLRPIETELGRKREIDQSSCNKDFSCLKGFCPSFVSVHGASLRTAGSERTDLLAHLPPPPTPELERPYGILITGVGGSGVITLGALIGMAAHLEGKAATVLDVTGLAQKNGAVMSHIRLARQHDALHAVRIGAGGADLLLGCDMVVAASPEAIACIDGDRSKAIVNSDVQSTAAFVGNPDLELDEAAMRRALTAAAGAAGIDYVEATRLATALIGDSIASNLLLLGYALQKGFVPVGLAAIERAIALNGIAVEANRRALAWGRLAAHDRTLIEGIGRAGPHEEGPRDLQSLVEHRAAILAEYQDAAYARRYREAVAQIAEAERISIAGCTAFAEAAARNLFKLMAYKDEYEVARLYTNGAFMEKLGRQFAGKLRLEFHLAPPFPARIDPATGVPRKRRFGPWMFAVFRLLARLRFLRGTRFDPFGYSAERRRERQLIQEYEDTLRECATLLNAENHAVAVEIARIPEQIRGFGPIKTRNIEKAKAREAQLLDRLRGNGHTACAA
jgi:indolepyruvate ferredoxin oxidoreductase